MAFLAKSRLTLDSNCRPSAFDGSLGKVQRGLLSAVFSAFLIVLWVVLVALLESYDTHHECVMIQIKVPENSVLKSVFVVKSYHVNMISEGARVRAIPSLQRLNT